jgi:hypothetical protein
MGCTYTLTPDLALVNPELDGVENFLRNTKEGYCVQFASSVALILRELGIPARYVEGYIGNEFTRADREDFVYGGYVRDYNAHAWVEVWFDGVGWITYETTPQYYAGLYGTDSSIGEDPVAPVLPEVDTKPPEESETLPEEDTEETDTEEETTEDPDVATAEVLKKSLLVLGVMAVLAAAAAVIATLVSRARAAEDHRQSNAAHILESGYGERTNEEDRRELALEVSDAVMTLLTLYGLAPKAGEFREEYADRLTAELYADSTDGDTDGEKTEGKHKNKKQTPAAEEQINLHLALDGMAAEEFGHGMTIPEMKAVAALYLALHSQARRRLTRGERFGLRYWKRKI